MSKIHLAPTPVPYTHSLRILFAIDGSEITVESITRVAMRALGSITAPAADKRTGYWFELHGDNGELMHLRPLRDPLPDSVEVFEDPEGGTMHRVPRKRPKQAKFEVIVPDLPGSTQFLLHGPAAKTASHKESGILLRHGMDELRTLCGHNAQQPSPDDDNT